jgi:alginate O-acetyltransferase complex protein AlgI
MVFSSTIFLLYFLPLFFLLYYLTPKKIKNYVLLAGSIYFYSWGAPRFIFVILGTTLLDFILVKQMEKSNTTWKRKLLLIFSIVVNLSLLAYFKYLNFFIDNINEVLTGIGIHPMDSLKVVLPIGISFYTFETLTYVVDVYRKEHKPLDNFFHYLLYIILFPKLIAGPIIRYQELADQISGRMETFSYRNAMHGFFLFVIGLSKKVLIANTMGEFADVIFNDPKALGAGIAWLGSVCYCMQLYFDFSGYSDMAIGLGKMMGFNLPENFLNPYISQSITEFWRRWHISLGKWMKNYLYIPLGGNRVSQTRVLFNLWLVFLLSGFWHGASWNFIFWGAFHGFFLILEKTSYGTWIKRIGKWPSIFLTFFIVNIGWIFFRSSSLQNAIQILSGLFNFNQSNEVILLNPLKIFSILALALFFAIIPATKWGQAIQNSFYYEELTVKRALLFIPITLFFFLICVSMIVSSSFNPFIYFRF